MKLVSPFEDEAAGAYQNFKNLGRYRQGGRRAEKIFQEAPASQVDFLPAAGPVGAVEFRVGESFPELFGRCADVGDVEKCAFQASDFLSRFCLEIVKGIEVRTLVRRDPACRDFVNWHWLR